MGNINQSSWLHLDINSYFAIMEQQRNPLLRGKPIGVVKSRGRTCIISSSNEAKALGIKTGCLLKDAQKLAPNITLVPCDFDYYLIGTKQLHKMLKTVSPHVEIFSLDEAFIDITNCTNLYPNAHNLALELQKKVAQTLGDFVTCNIGISWNRFLAKMASETAKKGSIAQINNHNLDEYLLNTNFRDVCGIGFGLESKLNSYGIKNLYTINTLSDEWLLEKFGPFWGKQLRRMGQGDEPFLFGIIDKNPQMKSVGRSITGWELISNIKGIKRVVFNLIAEVCAKARIMGLTGRYIGLGFYGQGNYWGTHITLKHYTNHTDEVFGIVWNLLFPQWRQNFKVIKFRVYLSLLRPDNQPQLFANWQRKTNLYKAVDQINRKFGEHTIHFATMHSKNMIYEEVTGFLGDKKYQFEYR